MPRDDWARARARDAVQRQERRHRNINRSTPKSCRTAKTKQGRIAAERLQSMTTRFWFGRHNGKTVREVLDADPGYIHWLASRPAADGAWRMALLVQFLRTVHT